MIWQRAQPVFALLLGAIAGLVSAAILLLWWRSPVPTFLVFTPVLHGMLIGVCLMWIVTRFNVHCPVRRTVIGLLAGVVSVAALLAGQYVCGALDHQRQRETAVRQMTPYVALAPALENVLAEYDHDVLLPVTGHRGVLGQFQLMTRDAPWGTWVRVFEALLVIGVATALCRGSRDLKNAARPGA